MDSEVESCFEVSDVPFFLFLGSGAFVFASIFLEPVAGAEVAFSTGLAGADGLASGFLAACLGAGLLAGFVFLAGALFAGAVGRDGFFGKAFTGLAGAFFAGIGAGFALAGAFFGAAFLAGTLAGAVVFLAGAFALGFEAAIGFLAAGFADFVGRDLPDLELDFAVGLEGFTTFFAALGLAAGRDGLFEEVVFVFNNLLSVRPGEKAVEHPPHGS